jgi:hypothetical protein
VVGACSSSRDAAALTQFLPALASGVVVDGASFHEGGSGLWWICCRRGKTEDIYFLLVAFLVPAASIQLALFAVAGAKRAQLAALDPVRIRPSSGPYSLVPIATQKQFISSYKSEMDKKKIPLFISYYFLQQNKKGRRPKPLFC